MLTKKLIAVVCLFICTATKAQDTVRTDAKLTEATIYYGVGAELTHQAKVDVTTDVKQIVLNQLSTTVDPNSLQINVPEDVALLSQQFSLYTEPVTYVVNPMVKKWQDSIMLLQKDIQKNANQSDIEIVMLSETGELIKATIAKTDVKNISADDALKLINFYNAKIEKSKNAIFALLQIKNDLNEKIAKYQQQINDNAYKPVKAPKTYGQLILQVACNKNMEIPVEFSYFTKNAGWMPLYDVRVNSKSNEIKLVYKASVMQNTGLNWKKTKLTLSTADPSWGSVHPILTPWYLQQFVTTLYNQVQPVVNNYYQNNIQSVVNNDKKLQEVVVTSAYGAKRDARTTSANAQVVSAYDLTGRTPGVQVTAEQQTVDPSTLQKFMSLAESQLNTNFEIDLPYNIESDGKLHSVNIKEEIISAALKSYTVPKLDKDAYLLAELTDWQKLDLLPGTANIIMDDTYVGQSLIDPNSTADTLNLSLGKDKRVAIKRSIMKDFTTTKTSGSSTTQVFTYEIAVKNNKVTDMDVLVKDQYPISTLNEIEVKLLESKEAEVNTETGVVTWKLKLKAGESKKLRFGFSVKYPKAKKVLGL